MSMPTPTEPNTTTRVSGDLLQQIRDFLDEQADVAAGCVAYEANRPLALLRELDLVTGGELLARRGR
jgi:hypothetical protein